MSAGGRDTHATTTSDDVADRRERTRRPLVLHTESSLGFGGQEIRILEESRWLLAHGWDVLIAVQPGSRLRREADARGLPSVDVRMRRSLDPGAVLALRRLMAARGVRLVNTHSSIDSWLATVAGKSLGLPVVRSRHVTIPVRRRGALVYHLADRIITSGAAVAALLHRAGVPARKVVPISAGVDVSRFHPGVSGESVRAELGLRGPLVGLVANIRRSKGHRVFLEAAARMRATVPEARFLIVGDGIGFERVRGDVAALGLADRVHMIGFRRDIPEVMAALDVLVLPSIRSEATPQVVPQALAIGTPVVATAVGGIPEMVRDGETGRLVPPDDPDALAEAIVQTLRDPAAARAMAAAGGRRVRATLSTDAMMATTTRVYAELLGDL